jgi:hypothetical protein
MDNDPIVELALMPEYKSIEDFAQYCVDDDRKQYSHIELRALCFNLRQSSQMVRKSLALFDIVLSERPFEKQIRGFTSNNHNRWEACKSYGGSGHEQINGFAGRVG